MSLAIVKGQDMCFVDTVEYVFTWIRLGSDQGHIQGQGQTPVQGQNSINFVFCFNLKVFAH